jgi:hypothetical protein
MCIVISDYWDLALLELPADIGLESTLLCDLRLAVKHPMFAYFNQKYFYFHSFLVCNTFNNLFEYSFEVKYTIKFIVIISLIYLIILWVSFL